MAHSSSPDRSPLKAQVEFSLLDRLHLEDDSPYAWQSLEVSPQLNTELTDSELGWTDAAIEAGAKQFFSTLDGLWEQADAARATSPVDRLIAKFGQRVPSDLLATIAERASALAGRVETSGQAALTQLIDCVDGSIPGWSADDWRTIARPYALAMRDSSPRSTLSADVKWGELSKIEREIGRAHV